MFFFTLFSALHNNILPSFLLPMYFSTFLLLTHVSDGTQIQPPTPPPSICHVDSGHRLRGPKET